MDCSTIIVSYNTFDLTRAAIESALKSTDTISHEVIVVDNNSPDHSAQRLSEAFPSREFPNVQIVASPDNLGFSKANNEGAKRSQGEVLFFLNPDTLVHEQAITRIYQFIVDHPEAGAVGPRVYNENGTHQESTDSFLTLRRLLSLYIPSLSKIATNAATAPSKTRQVDIVKGCALAIRRDILDRVGGWDESYFMYSEERELCFALQKAGYTNFYLGQASIVHYGGASSFENYAEQQVVQQRSALQFLHRHHSKGMILLNRLLGAFGFGIRAIIFPIAARLRPNQASSYRRRSEAAMRLFRWFLLEYS